MNHIFFRLGIPKIKKILNRLLEVHVKEKTIEQQKELKKHRLDRKIWETKQERIIKGKGDKIENELQILGPEPIPPPSQNRLLGAPTMQGMSRSFEDQPSLGLLSAEGGRFLGGYSMSKDNRQATLALLNCLWDGTPLNLNTKGDGDFTFYGRRLAMHLLVQGCVAQSFMRDGQTTDTGFLPRCLIVDPESTIGYRPYGSIVPDNGALAAYTQRLGNILATPMTINPDTKGLGSGLITATR